jgi:glutathione S-transferase
MSPSAATPRAKLYVILGSHACRSAMLMLEHKRVEFDTVELPSGAHPALLRVLGFSQQGPGRKIEGRSPRVLSMVDRLGTVPALRLDGERVMTNRRIARWLEEVCPEPALFPSDAMLRARVEEVEEWANEIFQMAGRRTILSATASRHLFAEGGSGRLGPLLFRNDLVRYGAARTFGLTFAARAGVEQRMLGEVKDMFDRIDAWIAEGLLDGDELNVADFMIVPSLALLEYHRELREDIAARPLGHMLERIMPAGSRAAEPAQAAARG